MDFQEFLDRVMGRTVISPEFYSADIVVINLLMALVLSSIVAMTYRRVHRGISYSQSYVYSIVIVSMTVALAMMVIGSDITRAFALLGTFTIIRYRTAVKDPKDTAFIFISLVVGLAVGSSNYAIAIAGTLVMVLTAIGLDLIDFGSAEKLDSVLYIQGRARDINGDVLERTMRESFAKVKLLNVNYVGEGDAVMYAYNVVVAKSANVENAITTIGAVAGVESAEILSAHNVVEF